MAWWLRTLELDYLSSNPSSATYCVICARWTLHLCSDARLCRWHQQASVNWNFWWSLPKSTTEDPWLGRGMGKGLGCSFPWLLLCQAAMGYQCLCPPRSLLLARGIPHCIPLSSRVWLTAHSPHLLRPGSVTSCLLLLPSRLSLHSHL